MIIDDNDLLQRGELPDDPAADAVECSATSQGGMDADWPEPIPLTAEPDPPAFPSEEFPGFLRDFVGSVVESYQVPDDLTALTSLGAIATSAGNRIKADVHSGYSEFLNLYIMLALGSGERKSSLLALIRQPIEEFEESCRKRIDRERTGSSPATRQATRVLFENITPEGLGVLLNQNGGQLGAIESDVDLKAMLGSRYGGRSGQNISVLLKGYSGEDLRIDRATKPPLLVRAPVLSLCLAVQPHVMKKFLSNEEILDRGLAARFLFSVPKGMAGFRSFHPPPPPVPENLTSRYRDLVLELLEFSRPAKPLVGMTLPAHLRFSTTALELYRQFAQTSEWELRPGGHFGDDPMRAWGLRQPGLAIKLSALLHLAEHERVSAARSAEISPERMENAIAICRYSRAHALTAFSMPGLNPTVRSAMKVLKWLQARWEPGMTATTVFTQMRKKGGEMKDFLPFLELLEANGFIRMVAPPRIIGRSGRPRSPEVVLHPDYRPPPRT